MENLTFLALFFGILGFCISLFMTYRPPKRKPRPDPRVLTLIKDIGQLRIEVADLHDLYERLMASHKRLRSSAGMAKLRAIDQANDLDRKSEAEILAQLNLQRRPSQ